jgi:hypothetical protein
MVEPRKAPKDKEGATSRHEVSHSASSEQTERYVFTLNATTREVINVEKLAPGGQHRAISDDEWATLASGDDVDAMMGAAQEAYAAGLIEGLKQTPEDDPDEEFALLQLLGDQAHGVELLRLDLRLALERRLLLRRLLRRYLLQTPSDPQQRRMPIAHKANNGSASGV